MLHVDESEIIWEYDNSLKSEPETASALVRQVVQKLKKLAWPESDVFAVHMALEEALMNAIKHGNASDPSKDVSVLMRIRTNSFYAKIKDEGQGFDPDNVPDPCDEANLDKASGRGVALIKNFVDFVEYNAAGNMVEFMKTRGAKTRLENDGK